MGTGRQVGIQEGPSSMHITPDTPPTFHAAWLASQSDRLLFFTSFVPEGQTFQAMECLVDADSQSILPVVLPEPQRARSAQLLTVCSKEGFAIDILCCAQQPELHSGEGWEHHFNVYDVASWQLLYQLSCPEQLQRSLRLAMQGGSHGLQATSRAQLSRQILMAPNKELLAVAWTYLLRLPAGQGNRSSNFTRWMALSIHSATTGDLQHSMLLAEGSDRESLHCQPSWLPCSSNLIEVSDVGRLRSITSSGCMLWSNARAVRTSDLFTAQAEASIQTKVEKSPCGRWILVMDGPQDDNICVGHIAAVAALTGQTLAQYHVHRSIALQLRHKVKGMWSMSGDVCLLEQLDLVLAFCQQAPQTNKAFQLYQLLSRASPRPGPYTGPIRRRLSLSPCGSTVIGLNDRRDDGLEHWQIPPSSGIITEAASESKTLQPVVCAEFMEGRQTSSVLQEAWHPLHIACMYAISCSQGGVHLIDAKANRCVWSWSEDELHGPDARLDPALSQKTISGLNDYNSCVLSWSKDGCRLAIASSSYLTRGARCCVLQFSEGPT